MRKTAFIEWIGVTLLLVLVAISFWCASSGIVFAQPPDDATVTFPDRSLEAIIRNAIYKPTGSIYISDLAGLLYLSAIRTQIYDLTGLEYCVSLHQLNLNGRNSISDISPLAGLTKLELIYLSGNRISDISPLAGLTKLEKLNLSYNQISDISPLAGLTNLRELNLMENRISDISPLAGLTNLEELNLWDNRISDISPMLSPKWLSRRYPVNLSGNPLSTASQRFGILLLQQTGVSVKTFWAQPDWSFIPGSLIAWAGLGFTAICYITASRRRKWLRLAALVIGVTGAILLALWLLPAFAAYSSFEVLSVPWGIAKILAIVACLIILTSAVIGWRYELFGGIILIVGGLIAGFVYPLWLFHTSSILTLFPLVSGFLYLLSWRERPRRTTIESMEQRPSQAEPRKSLPHALLISGIVIAGPIGLFAVLVYWLNTSFLTSPSFWEAYFVWLFVEAWCFAFTCSILARRKYW